MKVQKQKEKVNIVLLVSIAVIIVILVALSIVSIIHFRVQANVSRKVGTQQYDGYVRHYAFIVEDAESSFWEEVYKEAKARGEETGVYLEFFGIDAAVEYTKEERMRMAIAAKMDGIILEADESLEIKELIDEAVNNNIPVVTVSTDSYGSNRKSFIGIGSYDLGREYGRQIVRFATKETKEVLIIMDANMDSNTQNIIHVGIKETISNEGNHLTLNLETVTASDKSTFGSEEIIRDIFLDEENLPDIIICLNEQDTVNACQAAVDYNVVGDVKIIGYHITDTIANALERKILSSTIVTDVGQMGINSMDALNEYIETGHVNDYIVMEVETVTVNNMREYIKDAADENQQ